MPMQLRPYQSDAVAAVWQYLCTQRGNPVIVLPTGSGKSLCIAQLCLDATERYGGRVLVVAHRKELLEQNAEKIRRVAPQLDIGIYSAGLRSRDTESAVVCCGIQSSYKRAGDFGERHLVIIDENHLVPFDGEGIYRTFLGDLRSANPKLRCVGTTATPFRLDSGPLCRPDGIFQRIAYSAPIRELIDAGWLTNMTTVPAAATVDTSGLHLRGGEFVQFEAEDAFNSVVEAACREVVTKAAGRRSILLFCSGVRHAANVAATIERLTGERCGIVTGETIPLERSTTLGAFGRRELRWLTNVDVLTTGFDAPCIDCIAILRATMSAGLYAQICGRGFRVYPGKSDCLILDYGGNIARHGPLDAIEFGRCKRSGEKTGEAPVKTCPNCEVELLASSGECTECGFLFPRETKHDTQADEAPILSEPETWIVERIIYSEHRKHKHPEALPTLRVDYECVPCDSEGGNLEHKIVTEWVCIEHPGFAGGKARRWWRARSNAEYPATAAEAADLGTRGALAWPTQITTRKDGRWYRIMRAELEEKPAEWLDEVLAGEAFDEIPF
jgi:DNA repair protein RadD